MPACADHETMDEAAFAKHVKDIAVKIRNMVADIAASSILDEAEKYQNQVQSKLFFAEQKKSMTTGEPGKPGPYPIPADGGYSLFLPEQQKTIDMYRKKYGVDLLHFNLDDKIDGEERVKNELNWIVERFARGGNLPMPSRSDSAIDRLSQIAGVSGVVDFNLDSSGEVSVTDGDSSGSLSTALAINIEAIGSRLTSWNSRASDAFKEQFLPGVPRAVYNHLGAARTMRNVLEANSSLLRNARADVDAIAHDGLAAVESIEESCGDAEILYVLGGVLAAATVVAAAAALAPVSGIALVAAGSGLLSGVLTAVQTELSYKPKEHPFDAQDVGDVVEKIGSVLDGIYADLDEAYARLSSDVLERMSSDMIDLPSLVRAPRPKGDNNEDLLSSSQTDVIGMATK